MQIVSLFRMIVRHLKATGKSGKGDANRGNSSGLICRVEKIDKKERSGHGLPSHMLASTPQVREQDNAHEKTYIGSTAHKATEMM